MVPLPVYDSAVPGAGSGKCSLLIVKVVGELMVTEMS